MSTSSLSSLTLQKPRQQTTPPKSARGAPFGRKTSRAPFKHPTVPSFFNFCLVVPFAWLRTIFISSKPSYHSQNKALVRKGLDSNLRNYRFWVIHKFR